MPTVLRVGPYRFFFFAGDRNEPPHIHVKRDDAAAKFWLTPVRLAWNSEFPLHEIRKLRKIVQEHEQALVEAWHESFGN